MDVEITDADRARMKYYLKEMQDKFKRYPESICLRNGIAAIESRLGLPLSIDPIDPLEFLDRTPVDRC